MITPGTRLPSWQLVPPTFLWGYKTSSVIYPLSTTTMEPGVVTTYPLLFNIIIVTPIGYSSNIAIIISYRIFLSLFAFFAKIQKGDMAGFGLLLCIRPGRHRLREYVFSDGPQFAIKRGLIPCSKKKIKLYATIYRPSTPNQIWMPLHNSPIYDESTH